MRRWLSFAVDGARCAATLDDATGTHGLLIVSGGNEIRCGAHRGMAELAALVAARGHPVLRFDRRGVGDSEGDNAGFEASGVDIAAALALFRHSCPSMTRVTAFGNCDAASALLLHALPFPPDALLLANPWLIETPDADDQPSLPPPSVIRARYRARMASPGECLRLVRGGVDLARLARGLRAAIGGSRPAAGALATRLHLALVNPDTPPTTILIAEGDRTAQAFMAHWRRAAWQDVRARPTVRLVVHATASHSFADTAAKSRLAATVLETLKN